MPGEIVSLEQAAKFCGKSRPTLMRWISMGGDAFVVERARPGQPWRLDMAKLFAWREEHVALAASGDVSRLDADEARRRKLAAEAGLAELELALKSGQAMLCADVERIFGGYIARANTKLGEVPPRAAPLVIGLTDEGEVMAVLEKLIDEVRQELQEAGGAE